MNKQNPIIYCLGRLLICLAAILSASICTSCFTGVEGTKKIKLSRDDRKALQPTDEEQFFVGIKGTPLPQWQRGKRFIAADDKTALIFDQQGFSSDPMAAHLGGKNLTFEGIDRRVGADGNMYIVIGFSDGDNVYIYNTGKTEEEAASLSSDQLPMVIDCDMVEETRSLLLGKKFWIKSPLWYDDAGNRINGLKFVHVTIEDVQPASASFPLKLRFTLDDGKYAWLFMNFGNSGTESRSFPSLFSLTDIRKRYPSITDEVWDAICRGRVRIGMTKEECKLSLGNPSEVSSGHDYSWTLDLWNYSDGTVLWFEDGRLTKFRR